MLQLALGYVLQADREREVLDDLRSRQSLRSAGQVRPPVSPTTRRAVDPRRSAVHARGTGA
jgi:hypothetical protein